MLSVKEIALLIETPHSVNENHLLELSELSKKYPYSQLLPILYLNGLKSTNAVDFEDELTKYSYRISDRAQLYQLIHAKASEEKLVAETKVDSAIQSSVEEQDIVELNISVDETTEEIDTKPIEEEKNEQVVSELPEKELVSEEDKQITFEVPEDPLEQSILSHVVSSSYTLSELTPEEIQEIESDVDTPTNDIETESIENNRTTISIDTKQSFNQWLHSDIHYEESELEDKKLIDSIAQSSKNEKEELFGEVIKPKKEFFSPTKKAKESLDESELPVSETLAKIYAIQGNYPKAISAYRQLSLKYPEKKIFFANQIKKLEQKLNT